MYKVARHSPSSFSRPELQKCHRDVVCLNRLFEYDTIPIDLFQKEFGQFKDDCQLTPSAMKAQKLHALTEVACEWHENEMTWTSKVQKVFANETGLYLVLELNIRWMGIW